MYTNQTTHYAIPLPLGTDLTTPMDYNESMQAIDTAVWGAVQDAATATSDASNAVETANGAASDVGTLEGRVNTLEATVETQGNAIVGLVNTTTSQGTAIGNKFNSVAVADAYSPTSTYSVGDVVTFEGNRYKCITAVTTGEPFDVDKWQGEDIQTAIDGIKVDLIHQSMNNRKMVLFSDSYGTSDGNGGWCSKAKSIIESIGANTVDYRAASGYGFVGHDGTFLSLITTYANAQTSELKESITDIVIAGGWNDNDATGANIVSAIQSCVNYCKTTFPNATIWIGNIAADTAYQTGLNILRTVQRRYEEGCIKTGAKFMGNALYASWDFNNLADTRHPTATGYENIAYAIISTLINGSCDIVKDYIALTFTYDTGVTGPAAYQSMFNRIVTTYLTGGFINNTGTPYSMQFDDQHAVKVADVSGGCFCGDPLGTSGITVPMVFSVDVSGTVGLHYGSGKIYISNGGLYIKPFYMSDIVSGSAYDVNKIYFQTSQITSSLGISS